MQAYAAAKARLFSWPTLAAMVVNLDDPASTEMLNAADPDLRRIGYLVNDEPVDGERQARRMRASARRPAASCSPPRRSMPTGGSC